MKPVILGFRIVTSVLWLYWIWYESRMWSITLAFAFVLVAIELMAFTDKKIIESLKLLAGMKGAP